MKVDYTWITISQQILICVTKCVSRSFLFFNLQFARYHTVFMIQVKYTFLIWIIGMSDQIRLSEILPIWNKHRSLRPFFADICWCWQLHCDTMKFVMWNEIGMHKLKVGISRRRRVFRKHNRNGREFIVDHVRKWIYSLVALKNLIKLYLWSSELSARCYPISIILLLVTTLCPACSYFIPDIDIIDWNQFVLAKSICVLVSRFPRWKLNNGCDPSMSHDYFITLTWPFYIVNWSPGFCLHDSSYYVINAPRWVSKYVIPPLQKSCIKLNLLGKYQLRIDHNNVSHDCI